MKETRHLARCPLCREAGPRLAERLRGLPPPALTAWESERLWRGIRTGIEAPPAGWLSAIVPWLRGLTRRRPMLAWATAAAAVLLVLAPLRVGREQGVLSQATLNAQTVVEHIDAGPSTSVFVLETPREHLSIIWVIEPRGPKGGS